MAISSATHARSPRHALPTPRHTCPLPCKIPRHTRPPPPPWTEFLTHACENMTFPHLLLRTVTNDFISLPSLCRKCVLVDEIVHQMMVGCKDMFRVGCLSSSLYDILVKWICSFSGRYAVSCNGYMHFFQFLPPYPLAHGCPPTHP